MSPAEDSSSEPVTTPESPMIARVVQGLTRFWVDQGHLLLSPSDLSIPSGSMHPDVFFNLLLSRPWGSVVAQPVRRPRDGRWGLHPFRLARHLEIHVLLRGDVGRMQDLYLASLAAVGSDLTAHDLCFSDGPWESHSLAARGNGWHVQFDGLGVARLTFLRQLAGQPLQTAAAELVYGVERTALVLAGEPGLESLSWGAAGGPGEPWFEGEDELSRYAFEVADGTIWQDTLSHREDEARRCLAAGLPRMAYELAIGNLQYVELLLARGLLEIRDRLQHLQRVQELVLEAAEVARSQPRERRLDERLEAASPTVEKAPTEAAVVVSVGAAVAADDSLSQTNGPTEPEPDAEPSEAVEEASADVAEPDRANDEEPENAPVAESEPKAEDSDDAPPAAPKAAAEKGKGTRKTTRRRTGQGKSTRQPKARKS